MLEKGEFRDERFLVTPLHLLIMNTAIC